MKYKLTDKSITLENDIKLFQIKSLKSFSNVEEGNLGGFIESEDNLSQDGDCWIYNNAKVFDDAKIYGNAWIYDNAQVFGNAWISDNAKVYGNSEVSGDAWVFGNAQVFGNAKISDDAKVFGNANVSGKAKIYGGSWNISPICINLSKHPITSCSYSDIMIGCKIKTIDEWKKLGEEIGKRHRYSNEEIEFYMKALVFAEQYIELVKNGCKNEI